MLDLGVLNNNQREAVVSTDGPLLILAGAGSGKTKVLTYRIAFILEAGLALPDNILSVTFTNKAAGEMKERIEALIKDKAYSNLNWVGTFHSICVKILKKYAQLVGLNNNFTIYDSADQVESIREAMKNLNISTKEFNPHAVLSYISKAKNALIDAQTYKENFTGYFEEVVGAVYPEYQKLLRKNNCVDFDDLLLLTVQLFRKEERVLSLFQEQFKYILVDEYQDTNRVQYVLVNLLANKHLNICCVGDDDQSIYSFRGATIQNILSFEKDYKESKIIKLEQNYRSTGKILQASYDVISKNKKRKDKKLWTENVDGENITLYTAYDEVDESDWIVKTITDIRKEDGNKVKGYRDFAVLYRTNAQSRSLEEGFLRGGVPYKIVGGVRFYERKEIKDIISYLRLIFNVKDNKSIDRIINIPKRGIGAKSLGTILTKANIENLSMMEYLISNLSELEKGVRDFTELMIDLIDTSKRLNVVELLNYILETSGYSDMLKRGTLDDQARLENIKELITVAIKFKDDTPEEGLENFLGEISLLEGGVNDNQEITDYVTLMTIHAAKGLEFKYVYVTGMEEGLFPHSNSSIDPNELEEERRLAYVAITRARSKLYLTHTMKRTYFGKTQRNDPSRFLDDINTDIMDIIAPKYLNNYTNKYQQDDPFEFEEESLPYAKELFKIGDKVKHEYFGLGVVKYSNDDTVEVDFGAIYGVKELMLEYVNLQKIG